MIITFILRLHKTDEDFQIVGEYEGWIRHFFWRWRSKEDLVGYNVPVDHQLINLLRPRLRL